VFINTPVTSTIVAAASSVHLAVLLLRWHRNRHGLRHALLLLPSVAASASPWLFPTPLGLATGFLLHIAWFIACERLVPDARATIATAARPRTVPSSPSDPPQPSRPNSGFLRVPVIATLRETGDITTFRMARPAGFDFQAGQFITVRVNVDGKPAARCYTISSPPEATGFLEISIKRQGMVSGALHATLRPGSLLDVTGPAGGFHYPVEDQRPITLLAGGVGITPMMSMLRHAVHAEPTRPVTLLYSVHTQTDAAYRDELRWIARRHPQAKVLVTTTHGLHDSDYLSGRIDRRMLVDRVDDIQDNIFMICGPGPMIGALTSVLSEIGIPDSQIRSEAFEAAVAMANRNHGLQATASNTHATAGTFQLRLVNSGETIEACPNNTLLETCEAAGVDIPSVCRAGVCGSCRARLVAGDVHCDSDLLDDSERAEGIILPCVSRPASDCALEA